MPVPAPVLRLYDESAGTWVPVPAIRGDRGPAGPYAYYETNALSGAGPFTLADRRTNVLPDATGAVTLDLPAPVPGKPLDTLLLLVTGGSAPTITWPRVNEYVVKGVDPFDGIEAGSAYLFMFVETTGGRYFVARHDLEPKDAAAVATEGDGDVAGI